MKYVVTKLGPIDRHAPGTDVTGIYTGDVLARLITDGYIEGVVDALERDEKWQSKAPKRKSS